MLSICVFRISICCERSRSRTISCGARDEPRESIYTRIYVYIYIYICMSTGVMLSDTLLLLSYIDAVLEYVAVLYSVRLISAYEHLQNKSLPFSRCQM